MSTLDRAESFAFGLFHLLLLAFVFVAGALIGGVYFAQGAQERGYQQAHADFERWPWMAGAWRAER